MANPNILDPRLKQLIEAQMLGAVPNVTPGWRPGMQSGQPMGSQPAQAAQPFSVVPPVSASPPVQQRIQREPASDGAPPPQQEPGVHPLEQALRNRMTGETRVRRLEKAQARAQKMIDNPLVKPENMDSYGVGALANFVNTVDGVDRERVASAGLTEADKQLADGSIDEAMYLQKKAEEQQEFENQLEFEKLKETRAYHQGMINAQENGMTEYQFSGRQQKWQDASVPLMELATIFTAIDGDLYSYNESGDPVPLNKQWMGENMEISFDLSDEAMLDFSAHGGVGDAKKGGGILGGKIKGEAGNATHLRIKEGMAGDITRQDNIESQKLYSKFMELFSVIVKQKTGMASSAAEIERIRSAMGMGAFVSPQVLLENYERAKALYRRNLAAQWANLNPEVKKVYTEGVHGMGEKTVVDMASGIKVYPNWGRQDHGSTETPTSGIRVVADASKTEDVAELAAVPGSRFREYNARRLNDRSRGGTLPISTGQNEARGLRVDLGKVDRGRMTALDFWKKHNVWPKDVK